MRGQCRGEDAQANGPLYPLVHDLNGTPALGYQVLVLQAIHVVVDPLLMTSMASNTTLVIISNVVVKYPCRRLIGIFSLPWKASMQELIKRAKSKKQQLFHSGFDLAPKSPGEYAVAKCRFRPSKM